MVDLNIKSGDNSSNENTTIKNKTNLTQKISIIMHKYFLLLAIAWFILGLLLKISILYYVEMQNCSWFCGIGTAFLLLVYIFAIPIIIACLIYVDSVFSYSASDNKTYSMGKKIACLLSCLVLLTAVYSIASTVVVDTYYLIGSFNILVAVNYIIIGVLIMIPHLLVLMDKTILLEKIKRYQWLKIIIVIIFLSALIVHASTSIYQGNIRETERARLLTELNKEYENSIYTYSYTDQYMDGGKQVKELVQFTSYAKSSNDFSKNNYTQDVFITKTTYFSVDQSSQLTEFIKLAEAKQNYRVFASPSIYGYKLTSSNTGTSYVTEYFHAAWLSKGDPNIIDPRLDSTDKMLNINKLGFKEKVEKGDHIDFAGERWH